MNSAAWVVSRADCNAKSMSGPGRCRWSRLPTYGHAHISRLRSSDHPACDATYGVTPYSQPALCSPCILRPWRETYIAAPRPSEARMPDQEMLPRHRAGKNEDLVFLIGIASGATRAAGRTARTLASSSARPGPRASVRRFRASPGLDRYRTAVVLPQARVIHSYLERRTAQATRIGSRNLRPRPGLRSSPMGRSAPKRSRTRTRTLSRRRVLPG